MANKLWMGVREFAETFDVSYQDALAVAKSEKIRGYWKGSKRKQYVFNASACWKAYETGELEAVLSSVC